MLVLGVKLRVQGNFVTQVVLTSGFRKKRLTDMIIWKIAVSSTYTV